MAASVGEDPVSLTGPDGEPHDGCALSDWVDTGEISAEKGPGPWRKAKSLAKLKAQVDAAYPKRKGPDGFIGDKNHCPGAGWTGKSDHCLNIVLDGKGIVTAVDMRHEPENDCDIDVVVEAVRRSRDSRIKIHHLEPSHLQSKADQRGETLGMADLFRCPARQARPLFGAGRCRRL